MLIHPNEKVDHEEDIECQVDLLCSIICPGNASLHSITNIKDY